MFFLIPVGTDAPIYHWPFGTVALILINTLLFFLVPDASVFALEYGRGLHPLQWITSNYMHGDIFHLVGNMIFLWGFGIIVEGKLGWLRFLTLYNVIGVLQAHILQVLMSPLGLANAENISLGASSAIYGLMAISLIWAPKNELTVFLFVFFIRIIATTFEVTIMKFAAFFIILQMVLAFFTGFQLSSQMMQLTGATVGAGFGYLYLKKKWVDCEGWDLIAVMRNEQGRDLKQDRWAHLPEAHYELKEKTKKKTSPKKKKQAKAEEVDPEIARQRKREKSLKKIRQLLAEKKPGAALAEYQAANRRMGEYHLPAVDLAKLGDGLYSLRLFEDVIPIYEQFLNRFPESSPPIRLRLAAIYIEHQERPRAALRTMEPIPPDVLSPAQNRTRQKIEKKANQMIEEGVLEMEGKNWGE